MSETQPDVREVLTGVQLALGPSIGAASMVVGASTNGASGPSPSSVTLASMGGDPPPHAANGTDKARAARRWRIGRLYARAAAPQSLGADRC